MPVGQSRFAPGILVGRYRLGPVLGAGGMGRVYQATDTQLGRTVAIKVLTSSSAERRERFAREARVIAGLQHPHICALIDVGTHDGHDYLVMEYLAGTVPRGPLPMRRVLKYGAEVASALDAVHRQGIVHRDLKPANVLVTAHGIKVLDFGIATSDDLETVTGAGEVMGTPAYMAPEQRAGGRTDHRTDIYALGRLLLEMATGEREPARLPNAGAFHAVVSRCLCDNPEDRWQSARDVQRLLESIGSGVFEPVAAHRWPAAWKIAAGAILTTVAVLAGAAWRYTEDVASPAFSLSLAPPAEASFVVARRGEGGIAVAPDGLSIAFVAREGGVAALWVRRFDEPQARRLPGTEGGFYPFWSPDSQSIAFYTPGRLARVDLAGGAVRTICQADPRAQGGAWTDDGVILVTEIATGISAVSASGGVPVQVTEGTWPHPLSGGRFLFTHDNATWIGVTDGRDAPRLLIEAPAAKAIAADGHVLFVRNGALHAQPFDEANGIASGVPFVVADNLGALDPSLNPGEFSAAAGLLAYSADDPLVRLVWRDRAGLVIDELVGPARLRTPRISPAGDRVVYARADDANTDLWIADVTRDTTTRLTFDPASELWPAWSADGGTITFASGTEFAFDLFQRPADGSGTTRRLTSEPFAQHPMDWSPDGGLLAFTRNVSGAGTNLMVLPAADTPAYTWLATGVSEAHSQFGPGTPPRWLAYSSDDSGRREIYVKPFVPFEPAPDARWQVSHDGGTMPRWRGQELFYWALDGRMMSVAVDPGGAAFRAAQAVALFQVDPPTLRTNDISYDVSPDGQRFLLLEPVGQSGSRPLTVVMGWRRAAGR